MKIRSTFVTNSSSSSFITMFIQYDNPKNMKEFLSGTDDISIDIDELIKCLVEAKENGAINVCIEGTVEYD